ncbi:MAG: hypothetical protein ABWZ66_09565 [Pyrinomonadaceae bacterium]
MGKLPAIQFYTGDWLKDTELSLCSSSTRGIWIDILCRMHESGRSGVITGTVEQLCRVCRATAAEMSLALDELSQSRTAVVSERNGIYTIINRRMKEEDAERKATQQRVQKFRKSKNVTNGNGNVTGAQSPVNKGDKKDITNMKRKSNGDVTPYSSTSSTSTTISSSNEKEIGGGKPPPTAANSPPDVQGESGKAYLERKQREHPLLDVRAVYDEFLSKCGSERYPNLKNTRRHFDKWLEDEDIPLDVPSEGKSIVPGIGKVK